MFVLGKEEPEQPHARVPRIPTTRATPPALRSPGASGRLPWPLCCPPGHGVPCCRWGGPGLAGVGACGREGVMAAAPDSSVLPAEGPSPTP